MEFRCLLPITFALVIGISVESVADKAITDTPIADHPQKLLVTTIKNPLAGIKNSTIVTSGRIEYYFMNLISERLRFTYEICLPTDKLEAGSYINRRWTGALGQVERKEVDLCASLTSPSPEKNKVMDISYPVLFDDTSIIVPFPDNSDKTLAVFAPFHTDVWLYLITVVLFAVAAVWVIDRLSAGSPERRVDLKKYFLLTFCLIFNHNAQLRNKSFAMRVALTFSLFGVLIAGTMYTCTYVSLLAAPNYKLLVNSIEELAADPTIEAYVTKGSPTDVYLQTSTDKTIRTIGREFHRHPDRRVPVLNYNDIAELVHHKKVLISSTTSSESLVQQSYDKNKKCLLTLAPKTFYSRGQSITLQKESPLTVPMNREILLMHQFGLLDYAERRAKSNIQNPCFVNRKDQKKRHEKFSPIKLHEIAGAFAVLTVGLFLATIVFFCNLISAKKQSRTRTVAGDASPANIPGIVVEDASGGSKTVLEDFSKEVKTVVEDYSEEERDNDDPKLE